MSSRVLPPPSHHGGTERRLLLTLASGYLVLICGLGANSMFVKLREEHHLSDGILGLHGAMFGFALLSVGLFGSPVLARTTNRMLFRMSVFAVMAGVSLFTLPSTPATLAGAALIGLGSAHLVLIIPTIVNRRFGERAGVVFTKVNAYPGLIGIVIGPALGLAASEGIGWRRPLIALNVVVLVVALVLAREVPNHQRDLESRGDPSEPRRGGPRSGLAHPGLKEAAARNLLGVLCEYTYGVFGATALYELGGVSTTTAAVLASAYAIGITASRVLIGRLVRVLGDRLEPAIFVLMAVSGTVLALGGPVWRLVPSLALYGFAAGPVYTLGTHRMFRLSHGDPRASEMSALMSGIAISVGPVALGLLADVSGWTVAMMAFPVLAITGAVWSVLSPLPRLGSNDYSVIARMATPGETPA